MNDHQNKHDDSDDLSADQLMMKAENKHKALVERNQWNAKSKEEEQIIALNAELQEVTKKLKLSNKKDNDKKSKKDFKTKSKGGPKGEGKGKDKEKDKWKLVPPKGDEPKTTKVGNFTWNWCPHHKKWAQHLPSECRLKNDQG